MERFYNPFKNNKNNNNIDIENIKSNFNSNKKT